MTLYMYEPSRLNNFNMYVSLRTCDTAGILLQILLFLSWLTSTFIGLISQPKNHSIIMWKVNAWWFKYVMKVLTCDDSGTVQLKWDSLLWKDMFWVCNYTNGLLWILIPGTGYQETNSKNYQFWEWVLHEKWSIIHTVLVQDIR